MSLLYHKIAQKFFGQNFQTQFSIFTKFLWQIIDIIRSILLDKYIYNQCVCNMTYTNNIQQYKWSDFPKHMFHFSLFFFVHMNRKSVHRINCWIDPGINVVFLRPEFSTHFLVEIDTATWAPFCNPSWQWINKIRLS